MERIFLDANILFSAAYRPDTKLLQLWRLKGVELLTSQYALNEALLNLGKLEQRERLSQLIKGNHESSIGKDKLARVIIVLEPLERELPKGVKLTEKDQPILLAAIAASATHLVTGDYRDFGLYFGQRVGGVEGVIIISVSEYLKGANK